METGDCIMCFAAHPSGRESFIADLQRLSTDDLYTSLLIADHEALFKASVTRDVTIT